MARKKKKGAKQNATKNASLTRAAEEELVSVLHNSKTYESIAWKIQTV